MDATDDIAQTLTCNIGEVTQAVAVSWKNPSGGDITDGSGGYTVTQGSVDGGTQKSTLTITSETLKSVLSSGSSPLTWKCAAKSTVYPDSSQSEFKDVVVTFLSFGKFSFKLCGSVSEGGAPEQQSFCCTLSFKPILSSSWKRCPRIFKS